jgi:predicted enzyme related to lactoylglutathione lyase
MQILINIDVDDLDRAQAFYLAAFELRVGRRLGPDVVELLGGSSPLYLLRKAAGTTPSPGTAQRRDYRRHWSPVHLDFVVADLDAAVQRALAAGAKLEQPVTEFAWGRLATFAAPFGHGLCLLQFNGRGYDAIAV